MDGRVCETDGRRCLDEVGMKRSREDGNERGCCGSLVRGKVTGS
jgi:hypothetical protein